MTPKKYNNTKTPMKNEHIHYLKVLQESYGIFQKQIRDAIDFAIRELEK